MTKGNEGERCPYLARSLDTVTAEPIRWLWEFRLALGKLSILEGDPGCGKSFIGAAIAAALSRGDGLPGAEPFEPCSSLLLSLEDGAGDTMRPRIEGMGADLSRVHVIDCEAGAVLTLDSGGAGRIEAEIKRIGAKFVLVDPITSLLPPKVDLFRDNHVRDAVGLLVQIAARNECSVCIIRHLNKGGGSAKVAYRGSGSVAFTAIARTVMLVGRTPDGSRSGMVLHKSNIGPTKSAAVEFEIDSAGRFGWKDGESDLTAADLLAEPAPSPTPESPGALEEAIDFLRMTLADRSRPTSEVIEEANAAGVAKRTLLRAKEKLGFKAFRPPGSPNWSWPQIGPGDSMAGRESR